MIIEVTATQGVQITNMGDLTTLHVLCDENVPLPEVESLLRQADLGRLSQDDVVLGIEQLRNIRRRQGFTDDDDFDAMVRYAKAHDWVSPDGNSLRAHIEWSTAAPTLSTKGQHIAK